MWGLGEVDRQKETNNCGILYLLVNANPYSSMKLMCKFKVRWSGPSSWFFSLLMVDFLKCSFQLYLSEVVRVK